ncbi:MAG: Transposase domain [Acidobacteriaceae bacterium]|jgi:hypothetical protein|nr:Transposase domain [Acidobacteriaceae bacterium]
MKLREISRGEEARGMRRFRLRGLFKVTPEWRLTCATHNLLELFCHRTAVASPEPFSASFHDASAALSCTFRLTIRKN